ncbi:hypothetical protein N9M92_05915 [Flavobacteriaceae bacterium]|nr:hypothetical protein [Flavobacteriaceae bacterium]MDA8757933.1 hypothetical protein [Flavobacteriaceae bacterium]MDA8763742.1 hypothetical protein [Flavobacteriaceae bacterium]
MIRNIFKLFALFTGSFLFSQTGTTSPYSYAGLGEVNFRGTQINRFMGGLEIYNDSIHANLSNPSSYAKLKLTNYSLGLNYRTNNMIGANETKSIASAGLDYIGVALPTKYFGFGFGIIPYTSVGYKLSHLETSENDDENILNLFEGEGGINKVFFSVGFKALKNLSFGATLNYNFGQIIYETGRFQNEVTLGTVLENRSSVSGLDLKLSSHLEIPVNENLELQAMLSYSPEANLTSTNSRFFNTRPYSGSSSFGDQVEIALIDFGLKRTNIRIPHVISFGMGVGEERKWFAGTQYTMNAMKNFSHEFINLANVDYENGYQFSLGGFFIPDFSSITSYWKRIVFRMGFRHELTGTMVNNFGLKETGINFGLGLPLSGFSNANIGFEYVSRDGGEGSLFKENFWSFRIGFSLNDKWFIKRKFN